MKKYVAYVTESYYLDNYNDGEVDGTAGECFIEEKKFGSAKEAIEWFKNEYSYHMDGKLCYEPAAILGKDGKGIPLFIAPWEMQNSVDGSFIHASEDDTEDWKRGEIDLWNVEYRMTLSVEVPFTAEDFSAAADIPADWFEN